MAFTTYENTANPHVTIHNDGYSQIRKNGGEHKYKQGQYKSHLNITAAKEYASKTGLPLRLCSFCKPGA